MERLLTTKDLARAIGASESSLRRWTDSGAIRTSRTVGGHRRIALSEAIRFIRQTGAAVVEPAALGLQDVPTAGTTDAGEAVQERLHQSLVEGDAAEARGQILTLYLGGMSVAAIGDGPVRLAMERIGTRWQHDPAGILIEHRATDICLLAISLIRQLLPPPPDGAPVAIGGAPQGDPYVVPTAIAATVLAEIGWREINFGPNTPVDLLATAAQERAAAMVWLSISTEMSPPLRREIKRLATRLSQLQVLFVVGGRLAPALGSPRASDIHVLRTMAELSALARGAMRSGSASPPARS
jgi:MerR family transcriptional regulator, light-induced transcriptional regulator